MIIHEQSRVDGNQTALSSYSTMFTSVSTNRATLWIKMTNISMRWSIALSVTFESLGIVTHSPAYSLLLELHPINNFFCLWNKTIVHCNETFKHALVPFAIYMQRRDGPWQFCVFYCMQQLPAAISPTPHSTIDKWVMRVSDKREAINS